MTKRTGGDTVNSGPAPQPRRTEQGTDSAVGNALERGEDPSPDDRERGESSVADAGSARDRAR